MCTDWEPSQPVCWCHSVFVRGVSDGLRRILCQVGLQRGPEGENSSLVDQLMLNDSKMWKGNSNCNTDSRYTFRTSIHSDEEQQQQAWKRPDPSVCLSVSGGLCLSACLSVGARNIYHQLLMNSLLMDLKYKKIFAIQFAKVTHLINTAAQFSDVQSIPQCTTACCCLIFDVQTLSIYLMTSHIYQQM